jgi:hypothetical protein
MSSNHRAKDRTALSLLWNNANMSDNDGTSPQKTSRWATKPFDRAIKAPTLDMKKNVPQIQSKDFQPSKKDLFLPLPIYREAQTTFGCKFTQG